MSGVFFLDFQVCHIVENESQSIYIQQKSLASTFGCYLDITPVQQPYGTHSLLKEVVVKPLYTINWCGGYVGHLYRVNGDTKTWTEGPGKSSGKSWLELGFERKGWRDEGKSGVSWVSKGSGGCEIASFQPYSQSYLVTPVFETGPSLGQSHSHIQKIIA